jgi:organic hydroperoxide reductase OsmC/OhrA
MSLPAPFPHHYQVELDLADGAAVVTSESGPRIVGGPPEQFGGVPGRWSPEHLLLGSLSLCIWTTFDALARRASLPVRGFQVRSHAVLDKTAAGLVFTSFDVHVQLEVEAADAQRAHEVMSKAKKHCLVSNALAVPVSLTLDVRVPTSVA